MSIQNGDTLQFDYFYKVNLCFNPGIFTTPVYSDPKEYSELCKYILWNYSILRPY